MENGVLVALLTMAMAILALKCVFDSEKSFSKMETGVLVGTLLTILVSFLLMWFRKRRLTQLYFHDQGIPGPAKEGSIISGNLRDFANDRLVKFESWRKKYGPTFTFSFGAVPALVTSDSALLKEILVKQFDNFRNRLELAIPPEDFQRHHLLILKDDDWKRVRGLITPAFSTHKLKQISLIVERRLEDLRSLLKEHAIENQQVNFYDIFNLLTLDVIGEATLALDLKSFEKRNEDQNPLLKSVRLIVKNPSTNRLFILLPELNWLTKPIVRALRINANPERYKHAARLTDWLSNVLKERHGLKNEDRLQDMLQLMLDAEDSQKKGRALTDVEIISNAFVFVVAGYETTSTALSYTTFLLATHPEVQQMLYQEITEKYGDDENPSYEEIAELTYLNQVWNESLRIYPPVAAQVGRTVEKDTVVNNIKFPKDAQVFFSPWLIHHDEKKWPEPWKFDPERFSPENKSSIDPINFLPFGEGPRHCIGKRFAAIEAKLTLVMLVRRFKLEACDKTHSHPMKMVQTGAIMRPPDDTIYVKVSLRD